MYIIYIFIKFESEEYFEQNDLIILNVYTVKYIEVILYMFQKVFEKISTFFASARVFTSSPKSAYAIGK